VVPETSSLSGERLAHTGVEIAQRLKQRRPDRPRTNALLLRAIFPYPEDRWFRRRSYHVLISFWVAMASS
jgi:hypothetical protein